MIEIGKFEDLLSVLKSCYRHGAFEYTDPSQPFGAVIPSDLDSRSPTVHGIYVIRRHASREVLYVGMGGTVNADGHFKKQDLKGRLTNVRGNDVPADKWFLNLLREQGPLTIEYVVLERALSPGFVEALLLQSYLNEFDRLPSRNQKL